MSSTPRALEHLDALQDALDCVRTALTLGDPTLVRQQINHMDRAAVSAYVAARRASVDMEADRG